jgi:hypothetical protein
VKLAALSIVLFALGCGGYVPAPASSTDVGPHAQQALGTTADTGNTAPPTASTHCPAICGALAPFGTDAQSACDGYCAANPDDINLCDYCPSSNVSINKMVGCLDAFVGCQAYHCIAPSPVVPPDLGTEADAGVDAGVDAGEDPVPLPSSFACVANLPQNSPPFVCVMVNSPACTTPAEFCVSLPILSFAPGPDFIYVGIACDPSAQDAPTWCQTYTGN